MNSIDFLINTVFDLYLMVVILRIWLQLARADFYNPFSQFVVKATDPLLRPLRRLIPGWRGIDNAAVLLAFIVASGKITLTLLINNYEPTVLQIIFAALMNLFKETFNLIFWILIIRAILSWVSQGYNPIEAVLHQLTEPMLAPIRRVIPPMGGLDLSVLFLIIGLQFFMLVIGDVMLML